MVDATWLRGDLSLVLDRNHIQQLQNRTIEGHAVDLAAHHFGRNRTVPLRVKRTDTHPETTANGLYVDAKSGSLALDVQRLDVYVTTAAYRRLEQERRLFTDERAAIRAAVFYKLDNI